MIKRIGLLMVAALMAAMMMVATAAPAFAADPVCTKITGQNADDPALQPNSGPGTVYCTSTDLPGKSDTKTQGKPPVTKLVDETQGNDTNKHPAEQQGLADNECPPGTSPGLCKQAENAAG